MAFHLLWVNVAKTIFILVAAGFVIKLTFYFLIVGKAMRDCSGLPAVWQRPDLSNCVSKWMADISEQVRMKRILWFDFQPFWNSYIIGLSLFDFLNITIFAKTCPLGFRLRTAAAQIWAALSSTPALPHSPGTVLTLCVQNAGLGKTLLRLWLQLKFVALLSKSLQSRRALADFSSSSVDVNDSLLLRTTLQWVGDWQLCFKKHRGGEGGFRTLWLQQNFCLSMQSDQASCGKSSQ